MSSHPVQRILGSLLMAFSFFMLPPLFLSYFYGFRLTDDPFSLFFLVHGDGGARAFILGFAIIFLAGILLWYPARAGRPGADGRELKIRDGFLVVSAFWLGLGIAGAVPLMASDSPHMPLTDAVFESISGLTTTGATVLTGLDDLPDVREWLATVDGQSVRTTAPYGSSTGFSRLTGVNNHARTELLPPDELPDMTFMPSSISLSATAGCFSS